MPNGRTGEPGDTLRVWVLGGFRVVRGSREIAPADWRLRKARTLVKLLALTPGHRLHREQIIEVLWPDLEAEAASANLRKALHVARRVLEPAAPPPATPYLSVQDEVLYLGPDEVWVDVDAFERAADDAQRHRDVTAYERAVAVYGGDLLPDDRYEDWVSARREALSQRYHALLTSLASAYEAAGAYSKAIDTLQHLLSLDATREEIHRSLMRVYAATGRRQQAIRQYQTLRESLSREIEAAPDAASQRLYEDIVAGTVQVVESPTPEITSLAGGPPPARRTNLPLSLTSFVGRTREMTELQERVAGCRQLTLAGAGGVGKTRLALELAARMLPRFPDGVWLVDLSVIPDATLTPQAVASVLNLREETNRPLTAVLGDYLLAKHTLLVLDNCEHLAGACAALAESLLRRCADLHILVTSREVLGMTGEVVYRVSSLSVPDARPLPPVDRLLEYDAVRLFVDRAALSDPGFALTDKTAPLVAGICARLDGIPLAIELAAARLKALSVDVIAARLDDRFRLLTGGARTALSRHQTLRAAMDWSYDLLPEPERILLGRLSVFVGGFAVEAAQTIGAGDDVDDVDVLNLLAQLVDKSMVLMEAPRYRLLETVREYIRSKIVESGDAVNTRRRHSAFFVGLARQGEPELRKADQAAWLDRLEAEHDNLRAALGWLFSLPEEDAGVTMAAALSGYWHARGYLSEGRGWLDRALSLGNAPPPVRMQALIGAGRLAFAQDDFERAAALLEEAVSIARTEGDPEVLTLALAWLGHAAWHLGERARGVTICEESHALCRVAKDTWVRAVALAEVATVALHEAAPHRAAQLLEESLALFRSVGDTAGIAQCLYQLGLQAANRADYRRATVLMEEALTLQRQLGRKPAVAASLGRLGRLAFIRGRYAEAAALLEAGIALADELGKRWDSAYRKCGLGLVALAQGDLTRAGGLLEESLAVHNRLGDKAGIAESLAALGIFARYEGDRVRARRFLEQSLAVSEAFGNVGDPAGTLLHLGLLSCAERDVATAARMIGESLTRRHASDDTLAIVECLEGLACVACVRDQGERAARLFAAAEARRDVLGAPRWPVDRPEYTHSLTRLREALGEREFAAAWARGRTQSLEESVALGLT